MLTHFLKRTCCREEFLLVRRVDAVKVRMGDRRAGNAHMDFESTRIDVAATLYNNTLDHENWFHVYEAFTFASSREKLQRRLR